MRVDFYEMSGRFTDPLEVAGILIGKAWPRTRAIAVVGPPEQLRTLDQRLWDRPEGRFLPHAVDDLHAPIQLTRTAPANAELLINLAPEAAIPDGRYERVLEIVPPDEALRKHLRRRWMGWKDRGAELHHHVLK